MATLKTIPKSREELLKLSPSEVESLIKEGHIGNAEEVRKAAEGKDPYLVKFTFKGATTASFYVLLLFPQGTVPNFEDLDKLKGQLQGAYYIVESPGGGLTFVKNSEAFKSLIESAQKYSNVEVTFNAYMKVDLSPSTTSTSTRGPATLPRGVEKRLMELYGYESLFRTTYFYTIYDGKNYYLITTNNSDLSSIDVLLKAIKEGNKDLLEYSTAIYIVPSGGKASPELIGDVEEFLEAVRGKDLYVYDGEKLHTPKKDRGPSKDTKPRPRVRPKSYGEKVDKAFQEEYLKLLEEYDAGKLSTEEFLRKAQELLEGISLEYGLPYRWRGKNWLGGARGLKRGYDVWRVALYYYMLALALQKDEGLRKALEEALAPKLGEEGAKQLVASFLQRVLSKDFEAILKGDPAKAVYAPIVRDVTYIFQSMARALPQLEPVIIANLPRNFSFDKIRKDGGYGVETHSFALSLTSFLLSSIPREAPSPPREQEEEALDKLFQRLYGEEWERYKAAFLAEEGWKEDDTGALGKVIGSYYFQKTPSGEVLVYRYRNGKRDERPIYILERDGTLVSLAGAEEQAPQPEEVEEAQTGKGFKGYIGLIKGIGYYRKEEELAKNTTVYIPVEYISKEALEVARKGGTFTHGKAKIRLSLSPDGKYVVVNGRELILFAGDASKALFNEKGQEVIKKALKGSRNIEKAPDFKETIIWKFGRIDWGRSYRSLLKGISAMGGEVIVEDSRGKYRFSYLTEGDTYRLDVLSLKEGPRGGAAERAAGGQLFVSINDRKEGSTYIVELSATVAGKTFTVEGKGKRYGDALSLAVGRLVEEAKKAGLEMAILQESREGWDTVGNLWRKREGNKMYYEAYIVVERQVEGRRRTEAYRLTFVREKGKTSVNVKPYRGFSVS